MIMIGINYAVSFLYIMNSVRSAAWQIAHPKSVLKIIIMLWLSQFFLIIFHLFWIWDNRKNWFYGIKCIKIHWEKKRHTYLNK